MSLVNDKDGVWSNLGRFQQEKPWIKIANYVLYRVLYLTIILYAMRDSQEPLLKAPELRLYFTIEVPVGLQWKSRCFSMAPSRLSTCLITRIPSQQKKLKIINNYLRSMHFDSRSCQQSLLSWLVFDTNYLRFEKPSEIYHNVGLGFELFISGIKVSDFLSSE